MKNPSRLFVLLFLSIVGAMAITACGQLQLDIPFIRSTPVISEPTPILEQTQAETPILSATTAPLDNQPYPITLWLPPTLDPGNGSPQGNLLQEQLKSFSIEHPEFIVEVRIKAATGPGGLVDTLKTASAAAPDVLPGLLILPRDEFEEAARSGLLMPVESEQPASISSSWFPYAEEMSLVKGTRYGLPFAGNALAMAYKPVQVAYPPVSWQDSFLGITKVLAFPVADPLGLMPLLLYLENGGGFGQDETRISLDEIPLQKSLLTLSEGAAANVFPSWLIDYTDFDQSWQALKDSNATYAVIWTSQYLSELPENISIISLPSNEKGPFTLADGWVLAFPQTSTEMFARYQVLAQYLLETKFQSSWTEAAGLLPVSAEVLNGWKNTQVSGILLKIAGSAHPLPSNRILNRLSPLFSQATSEMIRKQTTYIESSNKILKALSE